MDKTLQDAIASLVNKTVDGVDTSVAFLSAELPDYIVQMLTWYGVYNGILFTIGLAVLGFWVWFETLGIDAAKKHVVANPRDAGEAWILCYGLCGMALRAPLLLLSANTLNLVWLKIWVAPKVWLVEYAASLAAKASGS